MTLRQMASALLLYFFISVTASGQGRLKTTFSAPGIQEAEGDYLLEVNGRPLAPPTNVYSVFQGTTGRQMLIRINKAPTLEGSCVVTVVPVPSDESLRTAPGLRRTSGKWTSYLADG